MGKHSNHFREIFNKSPIGILLYDKKGRLTNANPSAFKIMGIPSLEACKKFNILDNPNIASKEKKLFKEGLIKFQCSLDFDHIKKSGIYNSRNKGLAFIEWIVSVTDSGFLVQIQDITERKKAEEELQKAYDTLEEKIRERTEELEKANKQLSESEEKFREIFNKANDMISLNEIDGGSPGKFIEINEVGIKRLAYTREELLNMGLADIVAPERRSEMHTNAAKLIKNGSSTFEITHITKNGDRIPVEVNNHLINYKGHIVALTISRDITDRKKVEKKLNNLIEELQQFAYITSHDLQEPLRSIASFAQLMEKRYKGQLDSDADEFLDFMIEGASRMKTMIQGLLDYSRVGTKGKEFKVFNAGDALNTALINLQFAIEKCHAVVTHDPLPDIMADEGQIIRVFQNLIENALKFRKEGVTPKIHISASKKGDEYVFSVSDNGMGIDKKYCSIIFEIFKRLHPIGKYEGAGIGLAIVKRIIDRHGGHVWVKSEPEKGSTFYFTIPI